MAKNNRLTQAEKKKVFNLVVNRLVKQGRQSANDCSCVYRATASTGPDLKCAIGQLIPKKAYRKKFDEVSELDFVIQNVDRKKLSMLSRKALSMSNYAFLFALQQMHDDCEDAQDRLEFFKQLTRSARHRVTKPFKLDLPESLKGYLLRKNS